IALPSRLLAVLPAQPAADAVPDHLARAARSCRVQGDLRLLRRRAAGVDLRRAAQAAAARQLCRHGLSRTAGEPADAEAVKPGLPGFPRPHLPIEMSRPR